MALRTSLYQEHLSLKAKMVDFSGWEMPIHYGSQLEEHHAVRSDAGMFDVSHMCAIDIQGTEANIFLSKLLANDVAKLTLEGKALYSCMLNEKAGVIDDLIAYYVRPDFYRLVVNAGTRLKDLHWIREHAKAFQVNIIERTDLAIIAVQGPNARAKVNTLFPAAQPQLSALKIFQGMAIGEGWIARTGYTGEDGYEILLPAVDVVSFWQSLLALDIKPCGLGARDTLRLEAGMNLYGVDMDESTHPLESNLAWTIAFEPNQREFIGKEALGQIKQTPSLQFVGLVLAEKGVMRGHQKVKTVEGLDGEITSGTFSPTMQQSIALARIPATQADHVWVDIRGKSIKARLVKPPFVRQGKILV
jgi:aminomethyltransferase